MFLSNLLSKTSGSETWRPPIILYLQMGNSRSEAIKEAIMPPVLHTDWPSSSTLQRFKLQGFYVFTFKLVFTLTTISGIFSHQTLPLPKIGTTIQNSIPHKPVIATLSYSKVERLLMEDFTMINSQFRWLLTTSPIPSPNCGLEKPEGPSLLLDDSSSSFKPNLFGCTETSLC